MATYSDMQSRIADEINRTDLTSQIQKAILSAVQFYAVNRFAGNEKRGTLTTIAGTRFYATDTSSPGTLPSDIGEIDTVTCTVSGRDYVLERRTHQELEEKDAGTTLTTGEPTEWAWYSGKLRLYPTPNAARVITLSYQYVLTALSGASDSNFWTNDAEMLIRARAKKDLATNKLRDSKLAAEMDLLEREALKQLQKNTNKLIGSGRLKGSW